MTFDNFAGHARQQDSDEVLRLKDILFRSLLNITGDDWREDASKAIEGYSPHQVPDESMGLRDCHSIRPNPGMTFGQAIEALKAGGRVARAGWNGKGMFLFLVPGSTFKVNRPPLLGIYPEGTEVNYLPHIDMKTADGKVVPWLASQTDVLAEDWTVVSPEAGG